MIGGIHGIRAVNTGTGSLEIVANGDVAATDPDPDYRFTGIFARNSNPNSTTMTIVAQGVAGGRYGIFAQHLGTGALSIDVNGDVTGDVYIGGHSGRGILAQHAFGSQPPHGDVDIRVGPGATVLGAVAGIQIIGGNGTIRNYGTIRSFAGANGQAVLGDVLDDRIDNFGVVTGNVLLDTGINAFNNMEGGLFNSGSIVDLGTGTLTNQGTLSPGGTSNVLTSALTGNLLQPGSTFAVDIHGPDADRVNVSGSASMAGAVIPKPLHLDGTTKWTIMTSSAGPIDNGVSVDDTIFVEYELLFPSATEMVLAIEGLDLSLQGLNRNQTAIAENLNSSFASGDAPELGFLLAALVNLPSVGAIASALDQLSPEIYLDTEIATLFSSQMFASSLMTCPVREGAAAFIKEGQCVWARLSGRDFDQDQTFQTLGFDERSYEVAGGVQGALGEVWRLGFAGAYEQSFLDT